MADIDVGTMILPDASVIARNVLDSKGRKSGLPTEDQLAHAVSKISYTGSIKQIPSIVVTVNDPEWKLLDSGIWDTDENSLLDPIDLNYPDGSLYWWRLTIISPDLDNRQVKLTFLNRMAIPLMQLKGPIKADRAKMTRAEFMKMLADKVGDYGGINFYSKELNIKQAIAGVSGSVPGATKQVASYPTAPQTPVDQVVAGAGSIRKAVGTDLGVVKGAFAAGDVFNTTMSLPTSTASGPKTPVSGTGASSTGGRGSGGSPAKKHGSFGPKPGGLGANASTLTVKGSKITTDQIHWANLILGVGFGLKAGTIPLEAAIFAGIMESALGQDMGWDSSNPTYGGVLAGQNSSFARYGAANSDAVGQAEAQAFFEGNSALGYQAGGAIKGSATYPDPAELAARVEAPYDSSDPPPFGQYINQGGIAMINQVRKEAKAIVAAAGGGSIQSTGAAGVVQPYYFEVNPGETYWHAMRRLADEVNWELFWDGSDLFYDEEQSLITNQVVAKIKRSDPAVIGGGYDWDVRQIVTQMTLTLITEMFGAPRQGDVVQLESFGPASTGSAASPKKLPGRWLVQDLSRDKDSFSTTYTLVQPDLPKLEPAPQVKAVSTAATPAQQAQLSGPVRTKIVEAAKKSIARQAAAHGYHYPSDATCTSGMPGFGFRPYPPDLFGPLPMCIDCSAFAILCYKAAGAPDPSGNGYNGQGYTGDMEPNGQQVSQAQAQPGDLVFYPGHVAVYLGGGQIANMGSEGEPVAESISAPHGGAITSIRSYLTTPGVGARPQGRNVLGGPRT